MDYKNVWEGEKLMLLLIIILIHLLKCDTATNPATECSYLASYLAESILQFAMQNCQLLEVTVGFMDRNEDLVGFIDSLIKSTLGRNEARIQRAWNFPSGQL